jgi:hypothetical protein
MVAQHGGAFDARGKVQTVPQQCRSESGVAATAPDTGGGRVPVNPGCV